MFDCLAANNVGGRSTGPASRRVIVLTVCLERTLGAGRLLTSPGEVRAFTKLEPFRPYYIQTTTVHEADRSPPRKKQNLRLTCLRISP